MKYLQELHNLKIFDKSAVVALTGSESAAKEILRQYKKKGFVAQIKRDVYAVTELTGYGTVASKYEIAGNITPSSYLSYHSAMEYYGFFNQVFNDIYVSSVERFNSFDFEGLGYTFLRSQSVEGVVNPVTDPLVRLTDLERTIVDCLNRIDLCGGLEELVQCLSMITFVDEEKLLKYLDVFHKQVLYQKAGFVLQYFQKEMKLSESFFNHCKSKIGKSTRYLTDKYDSDTFFKEWNLCAPKNILSYLEQGGTAYV
jgi:predicted transcriptional regulator of viral defense system